MCVYDERLCLDRNVVALKKHEKHEKHKKHKGDETIVFGLERCSDEKARKAPKARKAHGAGEGRRWYILARYYLWGEVYVSIVRVQTWFIALVLPKG